MLHCSGFPIPIGSTDTPSAIGHLKGDDSYQLVLLELKSTLISASSLWEMLVSRGLNWELTIRSCHNGAFSRSPDATAPSRVFRRQRNRSGGHCLSAGILMAMAVPIS